MPNRQQDLFDAVRTRFSSITTANGYSSNVGQKINEWQLTAVDAANDPTLLPCICLSDPVERNLGPGENVNENSSSRLFGLEFEVALLLAESDQSAAKARQAKEDLIKAIGKDQTFGRLAKRTEPGDVQLITNKDGVRISGVLFKFTVKYVRKTWES
jgi:hypothetical protein